MEYILATFPAIDPLSAVEALVDAGLAKYYWVYGDESETIIAINTLGQVLVTDDKTTLEWNGQIIHSEDTRDPFGQTNTLIGQIPMANWRAFGHIAFDAAGYYLPYPLRTGASLMRFIVPEIELTITKDKTSIKTTGNLEKIQAALQNVRSQEHKSPNVPVPDRSDRDKYMQQVSAVVQAIHAGELTKAIIARKVTLPGKLDLFATYDSIRKNNPAARTYCFHQPDLSGVGSCPELLMQTTEDRTVLTNPLAGTRRRGATPEEDAQLKQELFDDPKEVKEHKVSVVLAEEELNQVCTPGTVHVKDFMRVIPFRTVQHLSSRVYGQLAERKNLWDALRVLFPGVTVSGIDKHAALAKIASLEHVARGPYAGCVGWVDSKGASDLAISIRSAFEDANGVTISAGAGIVAESKPDFEYEESAHKMKTMQTQIVLRNN